MKTRSINRFKISHSRWKAVQGKPYLCKLYAINFFTWQYPCLSLLRISTNVETGQMEPVRSRGTANQWHGDIFWSLRSAKYVKIPGTSAAVFMEAIGIVWLGAAAFVLPA